MSVTVPLLDLGAQHARVRGAVDAAVAVADDPHRLGCKRERKVLRVHDDVVVAEAVRPHVVRHVVLLIGSYQNTDSPPSMKSSIPVM